MLSFFSVSTSISFIFFIYVFFWNPLVRCGNQTLFNADPTTNPYFWGTWRPNLYFGLRTLSPDSLLTGLMWFRPYNLETLHSLRHDCKQGDDVEAYGFDIHNGLDYAKQTILDPFLNVHLTIQWIKIQAGSKGGDWIAKFHGTPLSQVDPLTLSLLFYAGFESETGKLNPYETKSNSKSQFLMFKGATPSLGEFSMYLHLDPSGKIEEPSITSMSIPVGSLWNIKKLLLSHFRKSLNSQNNQNVNDPSLFKLKAMSRVTSGNTLISQLTFQTSFEFYVSFVSHDAHPSQDSFEVANNLFTSFKTVSKQKEDAFNSRFESVFQLGQRGFTEDQIKMGKYALSNMIGGIGFFTGSIQVDEAPDREEDKFNALYYPQEEDEEEIYLSNAKKGKKIRNSSPGTLFTATPSRPFFPRGFLWDEGFHQLIVLNWDPLLAKFCLSSWYDRMDEQGWIAREQILGKEAESKVPEAFRVQSTHIANPPSMCLALAKLIRAEGNVTQEGILKMGQINEPIRTTLVTPFKSFLSELFPKLERHFQWFRKTQSGIHNQFGRNYDNDMVFRWRGRTMSHNFASGLDDYPRSNPPHIGELHVDLMAWMREYVAFLEDMSHVLGKDPEHYRKLRESLESNLKTYFFHPEEKVFADLNVSPDETSTKFAVHKGYISLLPWCLNLDLRGAFYESGIQLIMELMTDHGIASLHPSHPNYRQDENYWRGNIWINFQYLILRALYHHQKHDSILAPPLYAELREKIIRTLLKQFHETGFLFETYDGMDGQGRRSRPFTGWSSLILLIMAEMY